jgi:ABC-type lipoprotein export system ATPase subunit
MQETKIKILETKNISKIYSLNNNLKNLEDNENEFKALDNINLEILKNEIVCISGGSGAGKSTLLNILSGLSKPSIGEVFFNGEILPYEDDFKMANIRRKKFGFIFQFYNLLTEFSVLENVMLPIMLENKEKKFELKEKAQNLLEILNMQEKSKSFPIQLSGGEKQRVAIARALINEPEIIFADEPTGNLDPKNSENIYEILEKFWNIKKTTIIMVSHDQNIKFSNYRKIILEKGNILN